MPKLIGDAIRETLFGKNREGRFYKAKEVLKALRECDEEIFFLALKEDILDTYLTERGYVSEKRTLPLLELHKSLKKILLTK